jgi:hypothetical protein
LPNIQLATRERCLKGVIGKWLSPNSADLQKPPQGLTAVRMFQEGVEGGINCSLVLLFPSDA